MSFFRTSELAFGLDISDHSLRLAQLAKFGQKIKLQLYNEIKLPENCLVKGEIKQPEVFAKHLSQLMKTRFGHGALSWEAVIALPESETFLKSLTLESSSQEELPEKIKELLPQNLPIDLEEIYYDWQIVKHQADNYQIIVGASPKKIVDEYLNVFAETGIVPVVLEIEAAAIYRLLIEHNKIHEPQIVIDFGQNRTGLFLYDGDNVQFTVSLPISGIQIDNLIAQTLEITLAQAEEAKIICGLDDQKCQGAVLELLIPIIEELARQILNAVNFYYENFPEPKEIKKIVLCGGGANMLNITKIIEKTTNIPTAISEPFRTIANPNPKFFTPQKTQSFNTAIGLGLRGLYPATFYDHT